MKNCEPLVFLPELAMPGNVSGRGLREACEHTEKALLGVLELKVLVVELGAVDGLAASAIALGEVTTLDHKVLDDAVEDGALVAKALFARGQSTEVLGRLDTML